MGYPEQSVKEKAKLFRYKCRECGRKFKAYYLPPELRVCAKCYQRD